MGEPSEKEPEKRPSKWSPFRLFEWIDSHPSESRRRITQNLISGLVVATIIAIWGILWSHKDLMARFVKWLFDFLQSSIQLQLWILLLVFIMLFGIAWMIYWIRGKFSKITELEAKIKILTPPTTEEVLNNIFQRSRLLPHLITKSVFYPRINPTEDDKHGRRPHIHIEAAKPPLFDHIQGNYVHMGFELKEYGDMVTVSCVESMFPRLPVKLSLIDSFDNHHPVINGKEALLSIAHTRPPATR